MRVHRECHLIFFDLQVYGLELFSVFIPCPFLQRQVPLAY